MIGHLLKPAGKVRRERAPLRNGGAVACPSTVSSLHSECLEQVLMNDFRKHAPAMTWGTLGKPGVVKLDTKYDPLFVKMKYVFNNV